MSNTTLLNTVAPLTMGQQHDVVDRLYSKTSRSKHARAIITNTSNNGSDNLQQKNFQQLATSMNTANDSNEATRLYTRAHEQQRHPQTQTQSHNTKQITKHKVLPYKQQQRQAHNTTEPQYNQCNNNEFDNRACQRHVTPFVTTTTTAAAIEVASRSSVLSSRAIDRRRSFASVLCTSHLCNQLITPVIRTITHHSTRAQTHSSVRRHTSHSPQWLSAALALSLALSMAIVGAVGAGGDASSPSDAASSASSIASSSSPSNSSSSSATSMMANTLAAVMASPGDALSSSSSSSSSSSGAPISTAGSAASGLLSAALSAAGAAGLSAAKSMLAQSIPEVPYNILHNMKKMEHAAPFYGSHDAGHSNYYTRHSASAGDNTSPAMGFVETALAGMRSPLWKRLADTYGEFSTDFRSLIRSPVAHATGAGTKLPPARILRDILVPALFLFGLSSIPDEWRPVRSRRKSALGLPPASGPGAATGGGVDNAFMFDKDLQMSGSNLMPSFSQQSQQSSNNNQHQSSNDAYSFGKSWFTRGASDSSGAAISRRQGFGYAPPPTFATSNNMFTAGPMHARAALPEESTLSSSIWSPFLGSMSGHSAYAMPPSRASIVSPFVSDTNRPMLAAMAATLVGSHLLRSAATNGQQDNSYINNNNNNHLSASERDLTQLLPQAWRDTMKRTVSSVQQTASNQWKSIEDQLHNWVRDKVKVLPPVKWLDGALSSVKASPSPTSSTSSSSSFPAVLAAAVAGSAPTSSQAVQSSSDSSKSTSTSTSSVSTNKDTNGSSNNNKKESQIARVATLLVNTIVPLAKPATSSSSSSSHSATSNANNGFRDISKDSSLFSSSSTGASTTGPATSSATNHRMSSMAASTATTTAALITKQQH
ncbi:hypothetical protein GZH46_02761 [Fragariocoptes setiger]|uniref:Uncharacterized protein n=1 Tax=Fragariocoptes setiger TaxID=1670756 RepID=A0ABQ7S5T7_9ACAR|nr:hypothetical protein GZH46_02761 [Fragariocoptes setiger]